MCMLQVKLNSGLKFLTIVDSNYELGLGDKEIEGQPSLKILSLTCKTSRCTNIKHVLVAM